MAGALKRYRVMAYITGISLIILVLVMMPLRYIGGNAQPSELFSPFHGAMYMLYVLTVFDLFMRMKWELIKMVWVMLAGCIPFVSFVVERRITAKAREALAG
ncbi:MAG: DUF3817 domain-containing protein [Actinobacteria bacterium]|nr:DUF3817 domain-containing protein [Actinomycetota bacterium]